MKLKTMKLQFTAILVALITTQTALAQNLFGGIEIGSKGVKVTVVDILNAKKGLFEVKDFWTENTAVAKGISIDGNLKVEDIEKTSGVVNANYNKLLNDFKIAPNKIFIIISSGVGMAKNTDDLKAKIKELTSKEPDVISSGTEAKLLVKGGIPPNRYLDSLILDIGGGNSKGGYIGLFNEDNFVFLPLNLNLGTVTLTEKIKKKEKSEDFGEYLKLTSDYTDSLRIEIKKMYDARPETRDKKNVYMSGGAVWAFMTLTNTKPMENFQEFNFQQVKDYHIELITNYSKYQDMAKTNKEIDRVLKTYSQKHLISANNLLITTLSDLGKPDTKKVYFVRQGQIAWLLAYVVETVKNSKTVY